MRSFSRLLRAAPPALRGRAARLRRRLSAEGGFAVPTVMLMTVAALGMASVAVKTSVQGQSGTVRDQGTKSALAVAESGVSQALLHYNRGVPPCVPVTEGEWCGPVEGMPVNGGAVAYWARILDSAELCGVANEIECVEIVSVGAFGSTTRRVDVMASTLPTEEGANGGPFATAGVLSYEDMTLDANSQIHTGSATNGGITLFSKAKQCGPASVGIGKELKLEGNSEYHGNALCTAPQSADDALKQELTLPLVDQKDAAESNDNHRFFAEDTVSGKKPDACWDGSSGACGERELLVNNNSAVTLGGSVYSFCKLTLKSNSALYVEAGANATIYFDSPEECGYASGEYQLDLSSNSRITPAEGDSVSLAMLFVGSQSLQTRILLSSNTEVDGPCDQNFVIYAPLSDVELNSKSRFCGAIAGKSVHLNSNAQIWSANGSESFNLPGIEIPESPANYTPYRYVECSPGSAAPPNAGC